MSDDHINHWTVAMPAADPVAGMRREAVRLDRENRRLWRAVSATGFALAGSWVASRLAGVREPCLWWLCAAAALAFVPLMTVCAMSFADSIRKEGRR